MNVALKPEWTVERFLAWAGRQEARHEFDGVRPVAMTGGTMRHNRITTNIHAALRSRLRGGRCTYFGVDVGVRTAGDKVRFPDALVTCADLRDMERLAPDPVVVFEVLSSESGRRDRVEKVRDYGSVASIRRYAIVEFASPGVLVLHRESGEDPFAALPLIAADILALPEIGIEIPVTELYEDVAFDEDEVRPM